MTLSVSSRRDPRLTAVVTARTPLRYTAGADPSCDRPPQVRAGSSLAWLDGRLVVIQDDANFIARVDPADGRVDALSLPAGEGGLRQFDDGRGNKRFKLDLEACATVPTSDGELLLALGSGSTDRRESVVIVDRAGRVRAVQASGLYGMLRAEKAFSGSEMNIEGAVFVDGRLRLFNRGNGAEREGLQPCDASCDIEWGGLDAYLGEPDRHPIPRIHRVVRYDLGDLNGGRLTFTDAAVTEFGLLYSASAEDSADAISDGQVRGSAVGVLDRSGNGRWIELRDPAGQLFRDKLEGLCADPRGTGRLYGVIDADDPARPSELCEMLLSGPWAV